MTLDEFLSLTGALWSPFTFALLSAFAIAFIWFALAPSPTREKQEGRLEDYLEGRDIIEDTQMRQSFWKRALGPFIRKTLRVVGAVTPTRSVDRIQRLLARAGEPGGMTAPDVIGLQILAALSFSGLYLLIVRLSGRWDARNLSTLLRTAGLLLVVGFLLPRIWLFLRARKRREQIERTFSDALDLLSVGVEAGLAFDSALLRVCEHWDNALTQEFRRTHLEMRVGTPRNQALQRMADRISIQDIATFVGVLIQSSELGVSIAEVLHQQAAEIRLRRRMRAEELARQASVKMIFALVFFVFPALLVVLLGPGLPGLFDALGNLGGGISVP